MKAREVMTAEVAAVSPDTSTRQVARLLVGRGVSAVPVVDDRGAPVGMVSEGDLLGRDQGDREARRDWWLTLLAEGGSLSDEFLASLRGPDRRARDVMSAPVITVGEDTDLGEVARLLAAYRIKRVPVVRDGRVVGIVSRADLLRALAAEHAALAAPARAGLIAGALAGLDEFFAHRRKPDGPESAAPPLPPPGADEGGLTVAHFQHLVADHERQEARHHEEVRRAAAEQRRHRVKELVDEHVSDERWRALLHQARQAAENGEKELLLLRFPSELCADGGRAINVTEPDWPSTLRGEAAEVHLRWGRELKPRGFALAARVLDFPGGMPGDIGLFLIWGS